MLHPNVTRQLSRLDSNHWPFGFSFSEPQENVRYIQISCYESLLPRHRLHNTAVVSISDNALARRSCASLRRFRFVVWLVIFFEASLFLPQ